MIVILSLVVLFRETLTHTCPSKSYPVKMTQLVHLPIKKPLSSEIYGKYLKLRLNLCQHFIIKEIRSTQSSVSKKVPVHQEFKGHQPEQ